MTLRGGGTCRGACAACKFQRRRCAGDCPLAPYFPSEKPEIFQRVHKLFGVRSIVKILENIDEELKPDAMKSIIFEAYVRDRSPVYGCLGITHHLQYMNWAVEEELKAVNSYLEHFRSQPLSGDHNHSEMMLKISDIYNQEDVVNNNNNQSNLGTPFFSPLSVTATQQQQQQHPHMSCPYGYSEMNNNGWDDQRPLFNDNNNEGGGGGFSNNNGVMAIQSQFVNLQMESNHHEQEDDDIHQFLEVSEDKQSFVDSKEANASSSGESSKEPIDEPERRN